MLGKEVRGVDVPTDLSQLNRMVADLGLYPTALGLDVPQCPQALPLADANLRKQQTLFIKRVSRRRRRKLTPRHATITQHAHPSSARIQNQLQITQTNND